MAGEDKLIEFIPPGAIKSFDEIDKRLDTTYEKVVKLSQAARGITIDLRGAKDFQTLTDSTNQAAEANKKLKITIDELTRLQEKRKFLMSDEAKLISQVKAEIQQINRENKNWAETVINQEGSLNKLRAQLRQALLEWDRMSEAQRLNSTEGTALKVRIDSLTQSLNSLEQSTGRYQRNVGNYTSATLALSQVLREAPSFTYGLQTGLSGISNNIPILIDEFKRLREETGSNFSAMRILGRSFLQFSNIATLALTAGIFIVQYLRNHKSAADKAAEAVDNYNKKLKELNDTIYQNAAKEQANLQVLLSVARDTKESMDIRLKAVDKLQKSYPDYLGNLSKEKILTGDVTKEVDKLNKALIAEATVRAGIDKLSAIGNLKFTLSDQLETLNQQLEKAQKEANRAFSLYIHSQDAAQRELTKKYSDYTKERVSFIQFQIEEVENKIKEADKQGNKFADQIKKFSKEAGENLTKKVLGLDDKGSASIDNALDNLQDKIDKLKEHYNFKPDPDKFEKDIQESLDEVSRKSDVEVILDAKVKLKLSSIDKAVSELDEQLNQELIGIETSYQQGLYKSNEDYEKAKLNATIKYSQERYKVQIDGLKSLITAESIFGKDTADLKKKLSDLEVKQLQETNKLKEDADKNYTEKSKELHKELSETKKQFEQQAFESVNNFIKAEYDARANAIDNDIQNIETRKNTEINAINASSISQDEKTKAIAKANQKALQEEENLNNKKKQIQRQGAQFEKLASFLKVAVDEAQKIAAIQAEAALLASNPVTAPLAPLALAQIPWVVGASSVAEGLILAQPIPYAEGTSDHKGGPAIVGEEYKPEMIIEPGENPYIVDKPTLFPNMPAHTRVIPEDDIMKMASSIGFNPFIIQMQNDNALLNEMKDIKKAIINQKPIVNINQPPINIYGGYEAYINKNVRNKR